MPFLIALSFWYNNTTSAFECQVPACHTASLISIHVYYLSERIWKHFAAGPLVHNSLKPSWNPQKGELCEQLSLCLGKLLVPVGVHLMASAERSHSLEVSKKKLVGICLRNGKSCICAGGWSRCPLKSPPACEYDLIMQGAWSSVWSGWDCH